MACVHSSELCVSGQLLPKVLLSVEEKDLIVEFDGDDAVEIGMQAKAQILIRAEQHLIVEGIDGDDVTYDAVEGSVAKAQILIRKFWERKAPGSSRALMVTMLMILSRHAGKGNKSQLKAREKAPDRRGH
jgi:hypothetical protein